MSKRKMGIREATVTLQLERAKNILRLVMEAFGDMPTTSLSQEQITALQCVDEALNP